MKYQNLKMETKQKLNVGDKIICIKNSYSLIKDKQYEIFDIDEKEGIFYYKCNKYKYHLEFQYFDEYFRIKEKPFRFNSSIANWNKELKIDNKAYKETNGKLFYELDFDFITQMAERMASNKGKYEPYNWQKLDNVEELKQALFRHVLEVMKGNLEDDGRDFGHLEAIACDVMMIYYQLKNK